jgi:hypothetical protein
MVTDEEWKKLTDSYIRNLQFRRSLEEGIHAFNQAIDYLTNDEIDNISDLLRCIADQWDKIPDDRKDASMDKLIDIIKPMRGSNNGSHLKNIFDSLSKIPPDPKEDYTKPRQQGKSPRYDP